MFFSAVPKSKDEVIADLVYDTIMQNTQHEQFNPAEVDNAEIDGNIITFTIGADTYALHVQHSHRSIPNE